MLSIWSSETGTEAIGVTVLQSAHKVLLPAIVPPPTPHPDGVDGLAVQVAAVIRVNQPQTLAVYVHEQVLALQPVPNIHLYL